MSVITAVDKNIPITIPVFYNQPILVNAGPWIAATATETERRTHCQPIPA